MSIQNRTNTKPIGRLSSRGQAIPAIGGTCQNGHVDIKLLGHGVLLHWGTGVLGHRYLHCLDDLGLELEAEGMAGPWRQAMTF
jgi:hypothetical protein